LALVIDSCGKRDSQSDGARPAMNVIVPVIAESKGRPFINADVFRVGELRAMMDSGAKNSAICEEMLLNHSCFNIRPPSKYFFIDVSRMKT
jgi:hypothetical protein